MHNFHLLLEFGISLFHFLAFWFSFGRRRAHVSGWLPDIPKTQSYLTIDFLKNDFTPNDPKLGFKVQLHAAICRYFTYLRLFSFIQKLSLNLDPFIARHFRKTLWSTSVFEWICFSCTWSPPSSSYYLSYSFSPITTHSNSFTSYRWSFVVLEVGFPNHLLFMMNYSFDQCSTIVFLSTLK